MLEGCLNLFLKMTSFLTLSKSASRSFESLSSLSLLLNSYEMSLLIIAGCSRSLSVTRWEDPSLFCVILDYYIYFVSFRTPILASQKALIEENSDVVLSPMLRRVAPVGFDIFCVWLVTEADVPLLLAPVYLVSQPASWTESMPDRADLCDRKKLAVCPKPLPIEDYR